MSIHDAILEHLAGYLQEGLIDGVPTSDTSRAGLILEGPLQGSPLDVDVARISITIHENDPDGLYGQASSMGGGWLDQIVELECGGTTIWARRFSVKARCLLVNSGEDLSTARALASRVRSRIERILLNIEWTGVIDEDTDEYVSRGINATSMSGEMVQAGGPPDAYDYHIKVRFDVHTTVRSTP